jgi:hypothetical protein
MGCRYQASAQTSLLSAPALRPLDGVAMGSVTGGDATVLSAASPRCGPRWSSCCPSLVPFSRAVWQDDGSAPRDLARPGGWAAHGGRWVAVAQFPECALPGAAGLSLRHRPGLLRRDGRRHTGRRRTAGRRGGGLLSTPRWRQARRSGSPCWAGSPPPTRVSRRPVTHSPCEPPPSCCSSSP